VAGYQSTGWLLISNSGGVAQLKRPKNFNWVIFILGIILLLVIAVIYFVAYEIEKDEILTLTTDGEANLIVNGKVILPGQLVTPGDQGIAPKSTILPVIILLALILGVILLMVIANNVH